MRSRYDYPVFFDRILLSWDDTVKAIGHAIQGEGWRVDWEWDFNRGADGRVVLTNTKDESAPALVFIDPARCQQADAGAGTGSVDNCINNDTTNTVVPRRVVAESDAVGGVGSVRHDSGVPTAGGRATINDGTTRASGGYLCGETSGTGAPTTRVPNKDAYTLTRRGDTGTTGLGHASSASAHGDAVADFGGEKAGMFTNRHAQKENSFTSEGDVGAELGFTGARPHECHAGNLSNADAGATVSGERCGEGSCSPGILGAAGHAGAGAVWGYAPAQESTSAPGTHGGGDRECGASKEETATIRVAGAAGSGGHEGGGITSDDSPVGVPDGGFTPIVYVDYNHQEQDWFEVYGPDYTDDEGELLPEIAAAARHSIPAGGGVVPVSLGSFLQVIDVVKWWLGVDGNMSADVLGTLRCAMKGIPC